MAFPLFLRSSVSVNERPVDGVILSPRQRDLRPAAQQDGRASDAHHGLQIDEVRPMGAEEVRAQPPGKGRDALADAVVRPGRVENEIKPDSSMFDGSRSTPSL